MISGRPFSDRQRGSHQFFHLTLNDLIFSRNGGFGSGKSFFASSILFEKMSSYPVIATFVRQIKNLEFHVLFVAISVCLAN